jgi:DNA-binding transcriptional LysR family regulator
LPAFGRAVEINNSEAIKQSVIAEPEIAVLSSRSIELEKKARLLIPIANEHYRKCRNFYLVRSEDHILTGNSAALWKCLKECIVES